MDRLDRAMCNLAEKGWRVYDYRPNGELREITHQLKLMENPYALRADEGRANSPAEASV